MKKTALAALTLLLTVGAARALDVPNMKEGLWKLHMVSNSPGSQPSETNYSICRDHAYDQLVHELAMKQPGCAIAEGSATGNKRSFTGTCKVGDTTIKSVSTVTYSGDTSFHSETSTTYSPALYGKTQESTVQDQTYVGACPAGMNPGDIMSADGQIRHRGVAHP